MHADTHHGLNCAPLRGYAGILTLRTSEVTLFGNGVLAGALFLMHLCKFGVKSALNLLYWVVQKVCLGFSLRCYAKAIMNILDNCEHFGQPDIIY